MSFLLQVRPRPGEVSAPHLDYGHVPQVKHVQVEGSNRSDDGVHGDGPR